MRIELVTVLLVVAGLGSTQAQVFDDSYGFGFSTLEKISPDPATRQAEWTIRQNHKSLKLAWMPIDTRQGKVSCSSSGDRISSINMRGANPHKDIKNTLGEHRFDVTCTHRETGEMESRTAILTVEKGDEVLDAYVDAASQPVQVGSNMTFRWEMSPDNLRCGVMKYGKTRWGHIGWDWFDDSFLEPQAAGIKEYTTAAPDTQGEYQYRVYCEQAEPRGEGGG